MQRISTTSKAANLFGPGKDGFKDGNLGGGVAPTAVEAAWFNGVQEELMAVIEAAGIAPNGGTLNQLLLALRATFGGVVGTARNARMSVTAASASATFTADEIILESALGGMPFRLASFNKVINLATIGAGGMDSGTAPANGFVGIYAIFNPTNGVSALLAVNATSAAAPNVYGGANMPAGYTVSALVSVWPTNGSGQLVSGNQADRTVTFPSSVVLNTATTQASLTALSVASAVPMNARRVSGAATVVYNISAGVLLSCALAGSSGGFDQRSVSVGGVSSTVNNITAPFTNLLLLVPQTMYYIFTANGGSGQIILILVSSYEF